MIMNAHCRTQLFTNVVFVENLVFCYFVVSVLRLLLLLFFRAFVMTLVLPSEDSLGRWLSWSPLGAPFGALLGLFLGTVSAYPFDMLKTQEGSATAVNLRPAAGGCEPVGNVD